MSKQYSFEEKKKIVLEVFQSDNKTEACKDVGISRQTYYRWRVPVAEAIKSNSKDGIEKTRRPKKLARSIPAEIREKIISMASSGQYKSANAIAKALANDRVIHAGTVIKILEEAGFYGVIEARDSEGLLIKKKRGIIYRD